MEWDSDETNAMLANTTVDIKNGVLSFENPNYTLGNSLDDALNSNTQTDDVSTTATINTPNEVSLDGGLAALDSLYSELDHVCNLTRTSSIRNRRHYAHLDITSMGVDVTKGPVTNLDQADHQNNSLVENDEGIMGRKKGNFTTQPDIIEHASQRYNSQPPQQPPQLNNQQVIREVKSNENEKDPDKAMVTPEGLDESVQEGDSSTSSSAASKSLYKERPQNIALNEGHIPHMTPLDSQDLYALPVKRVQTEEADTDTDTTEADEKKDPPSDDALPSGWEKHEDNDGPYYWHIKSGTITRTPPDSSTQVQPHAPLRRNKDDQMSGVGLSGTVTRSNTSSALSELTAEIRPRSRAVDNAYKRRSFPARSELSDSFGCRPIRFAVRSLGWVEIAEEDLTPERSSKAVNRCIVDLSVGGRRDVLDVVGRWGDGKDLFMDLDEGSLKLVDPENLTLLNTQPIHTIRVWGVGRDNGRDFAYVARDRVTRKHMCHVFRCDTPARTIANTLRDICKKIMIERSLQQTITKPLDPGQNSVLGLGRVTRPTNLPTENRRLQRHSQVIPPQSFPTPMEEPKKVMRAQYVGSVEVDKPSGMEVLNSAIQTMVELNPAPWKTTSVAVAPSTITITDADNGRQLAECRVRFLSFLGIGQNVKHCAFIMHTAQDQFIAHVFYCEPSSGALCKTIEAACKLRYQKCLDAHPGGTGQGPEETNPRSLTATIRSVFTSFAGKKARSAES